MKLFKRSAPPQATPQRKVITLTLPRLRMPKLPRMPKIVIHWK